MNKKMNSDKMTKGEVAELLFLGCVTVAIGISCTYLLMLFIAYLYQLGL
jgi:hypothetical protein